LYPQIPNSSYSSACRNAGLGGSALDIPNLPPFALSQPADVHEALPPIRLRRIADFFDVLNLLMDTGLLCLTQKKKVSYCIIRILLFQSRKNSPGPLKKHNLSIGQVGFGGNLQIPTKRKEKSSADIL
jgi:hypothetical protein